MKANRSAKNLMERLQIPEEIPREWLRTRMSAGKIGKMIFTSNATVEQFIAENSSRKGGKLQCIRRPSNRGPHGFVNLYLPLDVVKLLHVKGVEWVPESVYRETLQTSVNELRREKETLIENINRLRRDMVPTKEANIKTSSTSALKPVAPIELYPSGKPLSYHDILKASGAAPLTLSGVYFLINNDEIVYVGKSINMLNRVQQHIADVGKTFNKVTFFPTPKECAEAVESYYIGLLRPRLNMKGGTSLSRLFT